MSIVVVGSVALDTIETPRGRVERALGGSAVYFSLAASYFTRVRLVGVVGDDFEDDHRVELSRHGIDLAGLETVSGGRTFFWEGRYHEDPNIRDTLVTELNVFETFQPRIPDDWRETEWLFLGNIDPDLQLLVLEAAGKKATVACDTMNYWIEGKPDRLRDVLEHVDILFVNDEEARQLSGETNLRLAARAILGMGPTAVVVKKGEHGAFLFTGTFDCFAPAYLLHDVVDPTGAGDSFAGGFLGYLAGADRPDDENLRRAMYHGAVTASFACESFSVERLGGLTSAMIDGRFDELAEMVRVSRPEGREK